MSKRILIGSMLVLAMLLVMPSIPAIQQKTFEEGIKQDLQEKLETITFDDLKDIKELDWIRHPILFIFVWNFLLFRWIRFRILQEISYDVYMFHGWYEFEIHYPLLFLRCMMLLSSTMCIEYFWYNISDKRGWNWIFPDPYDF